MLVKEFIFSFDGATASYSNDTVSIISGTLSNMSYIFNACPLATVVTCVYVLKYFSATSLQHLLHLKVIHFYIWGSFSCAIPGTVDIVTTGVIAGMRGRDVGLMVVCFLYRPVLVSPLTMVFPGLFC